MPADRSSNIQAGSGNVGDATTGFAFAPNVTPGTFDEPSLPPLVAIDEDSMLFPSQEGDTLSLKKTHGRKKPDNHIPRPPNAFILFRSSFIKNRHVSTGVETNHSTLSKIIGLTWQNLPNDERDVWHRKAKLAEEQHRRRFPEYAFRPLHKRKEASTKRKVREVGPKDEKRCAKIAELLVQGKKGKELDDAVKEFDKYHVPEIVTRFEAPITEESFQVGSSGKVRVKEEEVEVIPRSRSSSARRSQGPSSSGSYLPSPLSTEMLPLPSLYPQEHSPQFSTPAFDQFSFGVSPTDDQQFDFGSFSFNSVAPSSDSLYPLDSHSQGVHPLDSTFLQPQQSFGISQPRPQLVLPSLLDISGWSSSHSPTESPSTNAPSMPTTPVYSGTPSNERYSPLAAEPCSDGIVQPKPLSYYNNMEHFRSYQDLTPTYDGPVSIQVDGSHCGYSPMHMQPSVFQQGELDYSAFMPDAATYSL
ncbi:hypothetical protein BKA70DRAFT_1433715 [Coprinopsis sp. MPI-PUGE-AT-0042]|nr:hypothetical protein BKA70DRAFT_1433715 [Coprinopsis sp. MPI-PUGE-AT-0042]